MDYNFIHLVLDTLQNMPCHFQCTSKFQINFYIFVNSHNGLQPNTSDSDFVQLLSSQMWSQLICFESVPKIVTLTDHWVQFNSLNSIWQQLLSLLPVISKDLGWNFFKNHNKLCYDFFFLVGYYQTHFCFCETLSKTSSSK